jgi:hypothetical protein
MLSTNDQEGDMAMDSVLAMRELGEAELLSVGGGICLPWPFENWPSPPACPPTIPPTFPVADERF